MQARITKLEQIVKQTNDALAALATQGSPAASPRIRSVGPPATSQPAGSNCNAAIETTISGDFNGWDGETIFKLDNGQVWQQAQYDYMYSYSYRPDVTIYQTSSGCRMKVEEEEETILVKRIK